VSYTPRPEDLDAQDEISGEWRRVIDGMLWPDPQGIVVSTGQGMVVSAGYISLDVSPDQCSVWKAQVALTAAPTLRITKQGFRALTLGP
jgi:hypothetical protein